MKSALAGPPRFDRKEWQGTLAGALIVTTLGVALEHVPLAVIALVLAVVVALALTLVRRSAHAYAYARLDQPPLTHVSVSRN